MCIICSKYLSAFEIGTNSNYSTEIPQGRRGIFFVFQLILQERKKYSNAHVFIFIYAFSMLKARKWRIPLSEQPPVI